MDLEKEFNSCADAYVVVYNICDKQSFLQAREYLKAVKYDGQEGTHPAILLANKQDLEPSRRVQAQEGKMLGHEFDVPFFEVYYYHMFVLY